MAASRHMRAELRSEMAKLRSMSQAELEALRAWVLASLPAATQLHYKTGGRSNQVATINARLGRIEHALRALRAQAAMAMAQTESEAMAAAQELEAAEGAAAVAVEAEVQAVAQDQSSFWGKALIGGVVVAGLAYFISEGS